MTLVCDPVYEGLCSIEKAICDLPQKTKSLKMGQLNGRLFKICFIKEMHQIWIKTAELTHHTICCHLCDKELKSRHIRIKGNETLWVARVSEYDLHLALNHPESFQGSAILSNKLLHAILKED